MSETITIRIGATDFEVDRAINAYIPILDCSYQLAQGLPFRLPDGYQEIGRVSASAGDIGRMARAEQAPEAMPEARAMAAATAHPDLFGFIVREVATGAIIVSIRGTLVPEEWLRNFTVIPSGVFLSARFRHDPPRLPPGLCQRPREHPARPCGRTPEHARHRGRVTAWAARWPLLRGRTSNAISTAQTWTSARLADLVWASRTFAGSSTRRSRGATG